MNNLSKRALLNVPSPNPERVSYTRFIPREELGEVASWSPDRFGQAAPPKAATPPPPPPGPTAQEWAARVEQARQAGYQDGYRDGISALDGFKQAHAEQRGAEVAAFLGRLDDEFDALHERIAASVARVAAQLARQVLRSELQTAPELVARVAADAVEAVLRSARHITVLVHPEDLPLIAQGAREVLEARGARVVAHAGIERGGCRVESDAGAIDARIGVRWAQAASALGCPEPWQDGNEETTV